jgi:hypothetical protein
MGEKKGAENFSYNSSREAITWKTKACKEDTEVKLKEGGYGIVKSD